MTNPPNDDLNYLSVPSAEISIDDDIWHNIDNLSHIITTALKVILNIDNEISILLTNDTRIQILNRDFRKIDKPTNVLSFPQEDDHYLGDIAISFNTLEREALEQGKQFNDHFIHMLIHGVLHLKGYDHENDSEAEKMESFEVKILEDMGIKNPYI